MTARSTPKQENLSLLLALLASKGLPAPEPQFRFAPPRRWRLDLCYRAQQIAIEIEGGVWIQGRHTRGSGFIGDIEKYNEVALAGWMLIRITYAMIADGSAVTIIKRALQARGVAVPPAA